MIVYAVNESLSGGLNRQSGFTGGNGNVTFGSYAQDNDRSNGTEPIEWIVLDVQEGKALLLSKYGLSAAGYHDTWDDCTWETCSLRTWLNDRFLNWAFSLEEQADQQIRDTQRQNDRETFRGRKPAF